MLCPQSSTGGQLREHGTGGVRINDAEFLDETFGTRFCTPLCADHGAPYPRGTNSLYSLNDVKSHFDAATFQRGLGYASAGKASTFIWSGDRARLKGSVRGNTIRPYSTEVALTAGGEQILSSVCSCPVGRSCKHAAAMLLAALSEEERVSAGAAARAARTAGTGAMTVTAGSAPSIPRWQETMEHLLPGPSADSDAEATPLALQVELTVPVQDPRWKRQVAVPEPTLRIRPLRKGKSTWIKSQADWSDLLGYSYAYRTRVDYDPLQTEALCAVFDAVSVRPAYSGFDGGLPSSLDLGQTAGITAWAALAQLSAAGVPLVDATKDHAPVKFAEAEWSVDVRRGDESLTLHPELLLDGKPVASERSSLIGVPAAGLVAWDESQSPTLGRFRDPMPRAAIDFFRDNTVTTVPAHDIDNFLREFFPRFQKTYRWHSSDGSFETPAQAIPVLGLTLQSSPQHELTGEWWIGYGSTRLPLNERGGPGNYRDASAEQELRLAAERVLVDVEAVWSTDWRVQGLASTFQLAGLDTIRFMDTAVPALTELGVTIDLDAAIPEYRRAAEPATIHVAADDHGDPAERRDWFDLVVTVSVGDENVPFESLFLALASGTKTMILPSGVYFSLEDDRFDRLRELIEEARSLQDSPTGTVRLSRYQGELWDELAEMGLVDEQAAAWRRAAATLRPGEPIVRQSLPAGFTATLRPYQQDGYDWLMFLAQHRLGGILADDMGLGKTLQALAFMAREREQAAGSGGAGPGSRGAEPGSEAAGPGSPRPPFLVVAPTSVVSNWQSEAAKFAPGLAVKAISQTRSKRGAPLASLLDAARDDGAPLDIVITSYTLFRLDFADYNQHEWAGLILDEAQFVKNRQSAGHLCARKLNAPVKVAITGTPMENSLMDLWSLSSIVAPGLFPQPGRFTEYYVKPIERDGDTERLALLRRRLGPLMLRRTKEEVASELPAKQEQVIEVDLAPAHRKLYDTYLNRERQKVLGLVDNLGSNRFEIFRSLTLLRQASLDMSLVDDSHGSIPSAKLDLLDELLADIVAEGHRVLVFSQFTSFLTRARDRLHASGVDYAYLDGKTRNRGAVIERFRSDEVPVFFISLKAGGFGLNLTEADYCILLDPWWNPAAEAQAVDRTHRIGQTRPVVVYRLVSRGTIEEKVMALKDAKSALFTSVMGSEGPGAAGAAGIGSARPGAAKGITAEDIRDLLG